MGKKKSIGLIDVDGHNFPNLALMKLSSWHKNQGDDVGFMDYFFDYDLVYKSKVFTFTEENGMVINSKKIISGGIGYGDYNNLPEEIEHTVPDYSLYNYPHAMGFLTRGCPRKCSFCVVPKKEGKIREHAGIEEFLDGRKTAVLLDNNVLASEWGLEQIEKIISLKIKVDFNQGLDARIIASNPSIAKLLSKVKWLKPIRMACDSKSQMESIEKAVSLLREFNATPKQYFVYMLITDIDDAIERFNFLKDLKVDPFAQPLITDTATPTKEQKRLARYINSKQLRGVSWEEYKYK
jgi:hypothetical protein